MKSSHRYQQLTIAALLVFSIAALGLSLLVGSVSIVWNDLISFFRSGTVSMTTMVVLELRLPTVVDRYRAGIRMGRIDRIFSVFGGGQPDSGNAFLVDG